MSTQRPDGAGHVSPRAVVEHCLAAAAPGPAALATVYDVAGVLGLDDQPVRLAVRRMISAGLVEQRGRGRAGTVTLTDGARLRPVLDQGYWDFAARQDRGDEPWDGLWHLLAFSVPEERRVDRDALRTALAHLGAVPLTPGLYVSAHDLTDALAAELPGRALQRDLVVAVAPAVVHGGRSLGDLVADLWPLDTLREGYAQLDEVVDAWERRAAGTVGDGEVDADPVVRLAGRVALGAAVDLAVGPDPLLPPELLPDDWPGAGSRERVRLMWDRLDEGDR